MSKIDLENDYKNLNKNSIYELITPWGGLKKGFILGNFLNKDGNGYQGYDFHFSNATINAPPGEAIEVPPIYITEIKSKPNNDKLKPNNLLTANLKENYFAGKKKRKSRKSRKVRKSRKPRKSKRNRRKSTRNKKAGRWVVMPRQPGDPPTYIRMQWIDEYTTDDEEE